MSITAPKLVSITSDVYAGIDHVKSKFDYGECGICHVIIPLETRVHRLGCGHLFCEKCTPDIPVFECCPICRIGIVGRRDSAESALRSIEIKTQRYFLLTKKIIPSQEANIRRKIDEELADLRSRPYSSEHFKKSKDNFTEFTIFLETIMEMDDEGFSLMVDHYAKKAVQNIKFKDLIELLNKSLDGNNLLYQAVDTIKFSTITTFEIVSEPYQPRLLEFWNELYTKILENEDYIDLRSELFSLVKQIKTTINCKLLGQMVFSGIFTLGCSCLSLKCLRTSGINITMGASLDAWIVAAGTSLAMIPYGIKYFQNISR